MMGGTPRVMRSLSVDSAADGHRIVCIDADDTAFLWSKKGFNGHLTDMVGQAKSGDTIFITTARTRQYFFDILKQALRQHLDENADVTIRLNATVTFTVDTNLDELTVGQLTKAWDQLGWNWRDGTLTGIKAHIASMVEDNVNVVVSTPYDHVKGRAPGAGFDEIMAPFEADLIADRHSDAMPATLCDGDFEVTDAIRRDDKYGQYLFLLEQVSPFPVHIECFDDRQANLASLHAACISHYSRNTALNFSWDTMHVSAEDGHTESFVPTCQVFVPHNLSSSGANTTLVDRAEQAKRLHGALTAIAAMKPPSGVEGEFVRVGAPVMILPGPDKLVASHLLPCALLPLPERMIESAVACQISAARIVCNSLMSYRAAGLLLALVESGLLAAEQLGMIAHEYYQPDPSRGRAISATPNEALLRERGSGFNDIFRALGDRALMVAQMQRDHYGFGTVLRNGFQKSLWDALLADPHVQAAAKANMAKLGLTENSVLIMTTGIVSQRKGQAIIPGIAQSVMMSMAAAPDRWRDKGYDNVVFLMVGERHIGRPDEEKTNQTIESEIIACNLAGTVVKWPAVPQEKLAEYYAMFRMVGRAIALQTSNCEVMPVSVVEMINAGALPVVTAAGATEELIPATYRLRLLTTPSLLCQQAYAIERALLLAQSAFEVERDEVCHHALAEFDMGGCEEIHHGLRIAALGAIEDKSARVTKQRAVMTGEGVRPGVFVHPTDLAKKPTVASKPKQEAQPKPNTITLPFFGEVNEKTFHRGLSLAVVGVMVAASAWGGNKGVASKAAADLSR